MKRLLRIFSVAVLGLVGLGAASVPAHALPAPVTAESQFFALLNQVRAGQGLGALVRDPGLDGVAREWSAHMAATFARTGVVIRPGVKEHSVPPNCDLDSLCHRPNLAEAVTGVEPNWRTAGENVGTGGDIQPLHDAFVASPGHYANIIGKYNRLGVGVVIADGTIWVTFNFVDGPAFTSGAGDGAQRVVTGSPAVANVVGASARLVPVSPRRVLDTRTTGAPVPAGGTVVVDLAAEPDRPADATAVALNVTATEPSANGFLTVFPCGSARPLASSVNYAAGQTVPNNVTTGLGGGTRVCVYALTDTHVIVDLDDWYSPAAGDGAGLVTANPGRLVDTRNSGGRRQELTVSIAGSVPADATAVALNVTVTDPVFNGFLTVYPCGTNRPLASNLNFVAGQTVPNLVTVKVGTARTVCVYANAPTNVIVDLAGWYAANGRSVTAVTPTRLLDTRDGSGGWLNALSAGQSIDLQVAGTAGIPQGATGVLLNVTVTGASASGYVTVYPCGTDRPLASNLNVVVGQTVANAVVIPLGQGKACVYSSVPAHVIADVAGYTA